MASATDKLTIHALKQHDKIHPTLKATTGGGQGDQTGASKSKVVQVGQGHRSRML